MIEGAKRSDCEGALKRRTDESSGAVLSESDSSSLYL